MYLQSTIYAINDSRESIYTMTKDQQRRKAEFDALFESLPGKNVERIRKVCQILHYQPNTIRIFRMKEPTRMIPQRMIEILRTELSKQKGVDK